MGRKGVMKTPSEKEGMIDPPDVGQAATIGWHET